MPASSPLQIRHENDALYGYLFSSIIQSAWRLWPQDYPLSKDPDIYQKIRRDAVIKSLIDQYAFEVAEADYTIDPAREDNEQDARAAKFVRDLLDHIHGFHDSRAILAEAGIWGRRFAFIETRTMPVEIGDAPVQEWVVPVNLKDVDPRRFRWYVRPISHEQRKAGDAQVELHFFSVVRHQWEPLSKEQQRRFIKFIYHNTEDRLGYGEGLIEAMYLYYYWKTVVVQKNLQAIDRFANGFLIGTVDALRAASVARNADEARKEMENVLNRMRTEHYAVIEASGGEKLGDRIQLLESTGAGSQMAMEFLQYLDNALSRLILGAVRPLGGEKGTGGFAEARVEAETISRKILYARRTLDDILTRDLIGYIWNANRVRFVQNGMAGARMPRFRSLPLVRESDREKLDRLKTIVEIMPVSRKWAYKVAGAEMPSDPDDVLESPRATPQPLSTPPPFRPGE